MTLVDELMGPSHDKLFHRREGGREGRREKGREGLGGWSGRRKEGRREERREKREGGREEWEGGRESFVFSDKLNKMYSLPPVIQQAIQVYKGLHACRW